MKQTLLSIALLLLVMLFSSGYNRDNAGLAIGEYAPTLRATANEGSICLESLRGEYVLLTFWSSSDAESRRQANINQAWAFANEGNGIKALGVNFDEEPALFSEVARRDNLDKQSQFNVQGSEAKKIKKDFGLDEGYGSMLIGPDGRIIAFNPTASNLDELRKTRKF